MTAFDWLLLLQMAMGLFDILFHHETTERLTWRPSAARELRLHGWRNLCYAALFLTFAWIEWQGPLAWAFALLLAVELAITLVDFLEEDRSRLLPPSERVTHTLLALNYGALLALFLPRLAEWAQRPFGVAFVEQDLWSIFLTLCAIGVALWGWRDLARAARLVGRVQSARGLAAGLPPHSRVLVLGGSGFLGRRLVEALVAGGHEVGLVTRDPRKAGFLPRPLTLYATLEEVPAHARYDAVVNLAGEAVSQPWTRRARQRIVQSRTALWQAVADWAAKAEVPPAVMIAASAVGYYGEGGDATLTEKSERGPGFAGDSCLATERAAEAAAAGSGARLVALRLGLILAADGGVLGRMLLPFEMGLALRFGGGRQWLSWIHRDDAVRLICWAIAKEELRGAVNATAPQPVRQAEFSAMLSKALLPQALTIAVPGALIAASLGAMGRELFLVSQRVLPQRALEQGFRFRFPLLAGAFAEILGRRQPAGKPASLTEGLVAADRRRKRRPRSALVP